MADLRGSGVGHHRPGRCGRGAPGDDHRLDTRGRRKGGYEHFMLKEITEQPESCARRSPAGCAARTGSGRGPRPLRGHRAGCIAGSTSSRVAPATTRPASAQQPSRPARHHGQGHGRLGVPLQPPPLDERTLVIAVAQSGETAIRSRRQAPRQHGAPVIAVTNTVGSAITRTADASYTCVAGPEVAVASTKTFLGSDCGAC